MLDDSENEKQKVDWLGTLEPRFFFCLMYPRLSIRETGNLEIVVDTD